MHNHQPCRRRDGLFRYLLGNQVRPGLLSGMVSTASSRSLKPLTALPVRHLCRRVGFDCCHLLQLENRQFQTHSPRRETWAVDFDHHGRRHLRSVQNHLSPLPNREAARRGQLWRTRLRRTSRGEFKSPVVIPCAAERTMLST